MQSLDVGDKVVVTHYGSNFVFHPGKKSIFVAGGVGVTPLRSMIFTSLQKGSKEEMILLYLNNSDEFVFDAEFLVWQQEFPHFRYIPINTIRKGRISKEMLIIHLPTVEVNAYDFYISGPPLMIDAVSSIIDDLGLTDHIIHTDSFDGYTQELE
jgi:ferredoxin-NADP reductase